MAKKLTDYVDAKEKMPVFKKPGRKITEASDDDVAVVEQEVALASAQPEIKDPISEDFKTVAAVMATLENKIDALTADLKEYKDQAAKKDALLEEQMKTNAKAVTLLEKIQKDMKEDKNKALMEQVTSIKDQLERPVVKETVRVIERDEQGRITQMIDKEQPVTESPEKMALEMSSKATLADDEEQAPKKKKGPKMGTAD